jgi:predicted class III extradiol MEMO1 family dioxygenase
MSARQPGADKAAAREAAKALWRRANALILASVAMHHALSDYAVEYDDAVLTSIAMDALEIRELVEQLDKRLMWEGVAGL